MKDLGKTVVLYGGLGFGLYLLVTKLLDKVVSGPGQALTDFGSQVGSSIYDMLHPFQPDPSAPTYIVTFPDGQKHAVDSTVVDERGRFKYSGVMYQLKDDPTGKHYATPL